MNKKFIMVAICSIAGILLICGCMQTSKNTKDSQKGSELEAVDTMHILQVGEKAFDAELFDMQGNKHRLFEAFADGRYVLLDFWNLHCGACRQSESELLEVYERMKGKLEIVAINLDSISEWQRHEWSKKIVWKNWNDGRKFKKGGIKSRYYDFNAVPFYVLLSPDGRILWEMAGYGTGCFLGIAEALTSKTIMIIQILPSGKLMPATKAQPSVSDIIQRKVSGSALPMILTSLPTVRNTN